jgi:hypothetical protein
MPINVIGARVAVYYTGTRVRIAHSPIKDVIPWPRGDVWSPSTTTVTTHLLTPQMPAPIRATTNGFPSAASMPDRLRLKNGNGPDASSWDSPVQGLGHWSDEIGAAGSATEAETERCAGSGAPFIENLKRNFPSRTGFRPWTGGDDTILTPFFLSPMTDTAVDLLPALFLDYCTIADSYDEVSIVPQLSASDLVPLLTD